MRTVLAVILTVVFILVTGTAILRGEPPAAAPEPSTPVSGEELWQSLTPELLANVAEGKMEAIASYKSAIRRLEAELARVQEIEKAKLAESRPPSE